MVLVLKAIYKFLYNLHQYENDVGTSHLPFIDSPTPVIAITIAYVVFVLKLGPAYMRKREPFQIKNLILVYNVVQIFLNLYIGVMLLRIMHVPNHHNLGCIKSLPFTHYLKATEIHLSYMYLIVKVLDYMDTIFFVLRKNFRQISFLHVYHHVFMTFGTYIIVRYYGAGHHNFVGAINAFVHVLMYGYYFATAMNSDIKNSKWKQYITMVQLIQFVLIFCHQGFPLVFRPDCPYPKIMALLNMIQSVFMMMMFGDFYLRSYIKQRKSVKIT